MSTEWRQAKGNLRRKYIYEYISNVNKHTLNVLTAMKYSNLNGARVRKKIDEGSGKRIHGNSELSFSSDRLINKFSPLKQCHNGALHKIIDASGKS